MTFLAAVDLYQLYNIFSIIFIVIMVILSIGMIIIVMMQEGNNSNLGAISGAAESFFGKNKAKTLDAKFKRWTMMIAASILVCSIIYFVIYLLRSNLG